MLTAIKGEIDSDTIIVGAFNNSLSPMGRPYKRNINKETGGSGQDGGSVRHGDQLPSHRYSRNTSTRGTAPTEHPLNAGRRRQTSKKVRNSPGTWVGQKKKEITETKE